MKVYVLIKEYSDRSGFAVCGVTTSQDVAQAFAIGGEDGSATSRVYERDTDASLFTYNEAPGPMENLL